MRPASWLASLALAGTAVVAGASAAQAHPLGNLSVNTYDGVTVRPTSVLVDHVEDLAEIPALEVVRAADGDHDGTLSDAERDRWAGRRCTAAATRISVGRDGRTVPLRVVQERSSSATGAAGLPLIRVECRLEAATATAGTSSVTIDVQAVSDIGWREITLSGDGMRVLDSDVPSTGLSKRLTEYPPQLRAEQPDVRAAHAEVTLAGSTAAGGTPDGETAAAPGSAGTTGAERPGGAVLGSDPIAGLAARVTAFVQERTATAGGGVLLLLVGGALLLGAAHAAAPGHGKTVIAAAVIAGNAGAGMRRRLHEAVALGTSVTLAHTASVLALGTVLTVVGGTVPAHLFPLLGVVGGLLVVALGVSLLRHGSTHSHGPETGHGHGHGHGHAHGHAHGQPQGHGHGHGEGHGHNDAGRSSRARLMALGVVGGLTPSPTALLLLLGATAAGRAWVGVLAVVAFGVGMAVALALVGALAASGRVRLARIATSNGTVARLSLVVPRLAGLGVVGGGSFLVLRGLAQTAGW